MNPDAALTGWHLLVAAGSVAAGLLTIHSLVNAVLLRRPPGRPPPATATVAVLLPVRDEAHQVGRCVAALLAQQGVPGLEIIVLDDGSTDGTAAAVRAAAGDDPRVRLLAGSPPPPGWLGKPYACQRLAAETGAGVLVFVDADVVLSPWAVAGCLAVLDRSRADLVSPYPRVIARGAGERLVQPLLQWSWLTFLPVPAVERSRRPSLAAAGGQLLVVRATAYRRCGGHAAVRGQVLEDVALARSVKRSGGRIALADGSGLASCRMYPSWPGLVDGYTKSLWAAFRPVAAVAVVALLLVVYLVPALAAITGSGVGLAGYLCGVAGRVVTARATGGRWWPDALAHPVSVVLFGWLVAASHRRHRRGELRWKGRVLPGAAGAGPDRVPGPTGRPDGNV